MSIQISITSGKSGVTIAINQSGTTCQGVVSQDVVSQGIVSHEIDLRDQSARTSAEADAGGSGPLVPPGSGGVHSAASPRAGGSGPLVPPGSGGGGAAIGSGVVVVGPIVVQPQSGAAVPPGSGGHLQPASARSGGSGAAVPPGSGGSGVSDGPVVGPESGGGPVFPPGSGGRVAGSGVVVVGPIVVEPGRMLKDPDSGVVVPPDSGGHAIIIVSTGVGADAAASGSPLVIGPIVISMSNDPGTSAVDAEQDDDEQDEVDC
jgi:hypothetical protein